MNNPGLGGNRRLAAVSAGQIKIIIMTSNTGGNTLTITGSSVEGSGAFDAAGETATMIYTNSKGYMIGGTASYS